MRAGLCCVFAILLGCSQPQSNLTVLMGPETAVGPGGPVIPDSIIVIAGSKIRAVGPRRDVPVPQDSERIDLSGKSIVPAAGGRIAPGEPASFEVRERGFDGPVVRRMASGQWR